MSSIVNDFSDSISQELSRIDCNILWLEENRNLGVDLAVVNDLVDQLAGQISECSISIAHCSEGVRSQLNQVQARFDAFINSSGEYSFASQFSFSNSVALLTEETPDEKLQQDLIRADIHAAPEPILAPLAPSYLEVAGLVIKKIGQTVFAYPIAAASTVIAFSALWLIS